MKTSNIFKLLSIFSYCLIMIQGSIIGVPLIFVLFVSQFEPSNFNIITAIFALVGLCTIMINSNFLKNRTVSYLQVLIFFFLISPLIYRIINFEMKFFTNAYFILPLISFTTFYILFMFYYHLERKTTI